MNQIEPIAAYLPYMVCVGNHEHSYNFSNYVARFSMPNYSGGGSVGGDNNHFYSIDIGPIHFILFSTEFYYFIEYGTHQIVNQYNWIINDLKVINCFNQNIN
jgi:acid phosphatase type 7